MTSAEPVSDLVAHLVRTTPLSPAGAERVVDEVVCFFGETPEEFVRRRHKELQGAGHQNTEIFEAIAAELTRRRFAAPDLSERQIRRLVYG